MQTIDNISFEANRWEIVEFVDLSVRAAAMHVRGEGNQTTQIIWKDDLKRNQLIPKLRLILNAPNGDLLLKFILRGHFTILGKEEINTTPNTIHMSKAVALAIAYEVWDYAMDYLSKRPTPINSVQISRPPDEGLLAEINFPGFSLN